MVRCIRASALDDAVGRKLTRKEVHPLGLDDGLVAVV
eukprot:CAMPEP_0168463456 /NCGR_PEP_ID=MMETSP0228-20121227/55064_1 /TAXON_ID=133427 /ORGANISM="Protoceratium reticulatum, Strain CCCM 535 (=CCMP 1889)" /LENGTH=36 /DNA_ID= /DNA_START= /DNA_END= /DNA_ORIENTATION=